MHPEVPLKTALDIGAGPGTALFALSEVFPELETISLFEKERAFIELGKKLSDDPRAVWQEGKIDQNVHLEPHDLVILAYSLGEFASLCNEELIAKLWQATKEFLIIIEPGTPLGFSHILQMRTRLLSLGAQIIAPCPHQGRCPESWCHFAARCERSSAHRFLKGGSLNYEDEKFSYIIASKNSQTVNTARILRHVEKSKGEILLTLCTEEGIEKKRITRKNKQLYQIARKAEWGDTFSEQLD